MEKIKNSFSGIIVGFILIVIGAGVIWWNEGNNVKNIKSIEEGRKSLVQADSKKVDKANDNKLVAISGELIVGDDYLSDSTFKINAEKTARLIRIVEVYQWEEEENTENDETTYSYKKVWKEDIIKSEDFNNKMGHENPEVMPYDKEIYSAKDVNVGEYSLSDNMIGRLQTKATLEVEGCQLKGTCFLPTGYKTIKNYITNVVDSENPQVGDVRIHYVYNNDEKVSVLGKQNGNVIGEYITSNNKDISKVESGLVTGEEMIDHIENGNNTMKWLFRVIGSLLVMFGCTSVINPIVTLTSFIPLLGGGISKLISLAGMMVGLALSFVIMAVAWIAYRPVIAFALLAGVVLLIVGAITLVLKLRKKNTAAV